MVFVKKIVFISLFTVIALLGQGVARPNNSEICDDTETIATRSTPGFSGSIEISRTNNASNSKSSFRVAVICRKPCRSLILRAIHARSTALAAGRWMVDSDNSVDVISCSFYRDTVVKRHALSSSITGLWIAQGPRRAVRFRAWSLADHSQKWSTITSDIIPIGTGDNSFQRKTKSRILHHVAKRDAENEVTTESGSDSVTSSSQPGSTRASDKTQSLFVLFTIIGAYIGMYTIFSLLLI